MAVDYLSALNIGSGLNTTQIIDALVDAERAPTENAIKGVQEKRTVQISSLGQVKSDFEGFSASLDILDGTTGLGTFQTGNSIGIEVSDAARASAFSHRIEVDTLAAAHTLVFGGFDGEAAAIGTGTLSFDFGSWNSLTETFSANPDVGQTAIEITDENNSLIGLRDTINSADMDVTASILKTGDADYALILTSREGANHAMRISATESPGGSGLNSLAYGAVDGDIETVTAADATFSLDGTTVTRASNEIDDLLDGVTLTLRSPTLVPETFGLRHDANLAQTAMQALIDQVNLLQTNLQTLTARGVNGGESGPLAGDPLVRSMQNQLRAFTTTPIHGYGDDARYLAEFGVKTERNGTLSLDAEAFQKAFEADPDGFAAIVHSRVKTDTSMVAGAVTGTAYQPGVYEFDIAADGTATLDGTAMTRTDNQYSITDGDAAGLTLTTRDGGRDTKVYIGISLIDSLREFSTDILKTNSAIDSKLARYNQDLRDYEDQLADLDAKIANVRSRYLERFTAMEKAVAALKETGESLTNMMDAWKNIYKD